MIVYLYPYKDTILLNKYQDKVKQNSMDLKNNRNK